MPAAHQHAFDDRLAAIVEGGRGGGGGIDDRREQEVADTTEAGR